MPLTDFLLTFAVEHVQHGFSDFARSYCTMDTPRRQLLLQMFFFFLGGGCMDIVYRIYIVISYNINLYKNMIYIEYIYIEIWYMKCICKYILFEVYVYIQVFQAVKCWKHFSPSQLIHQLHLNRPGKIGAGENLRNPSGTPGTISGTVSDGNETLQMMRFFHFLHEKYILYTIVFACSERVLFQTVPKSTILIG